MNINDFVAVVIVGLIGGLLAKAFRQPLILGYIIAGVVVGQSTPGFQLSDPDAIIQLADFGVALLLFSLGLEFSVRDLKPIWKIAGFGAGIQVALTLLLGFLLGRALGWEPLPSFCLGICIVSSSTAVIMKSLSGIGQMGTLSSRVMLGMSIAQDMTVIPLLLVLLSMKTGGISIINVFWPLFVATLFVGVTFLVGNRILPRMLRLIARLNSQELFLLCVLTIALGIGYIAQCLELSFAFGTFIAGLVLNGSAYGHKALSELIPLRDVFAMVFFASVGTFLDPMFVWANMGTILLVVVVACLGRGLILSGVSWLFGYRNVIPLAALLGMFPISEIGFIAINQAMKADVIGPDKFSIILNAIVISMIIGPITTGFTGPIYAWKKRRWPKVTVDTYNIEETALKDHVVIAGSGHLARYMAAILRKIGLRYVLIDPLHSDFVLSREAGLSTIFGDPKQAAILTIAHVQNAKIFIVTTDALSETLGIIRAARSLKPDLTIISQSEGDDNVELLRAEKIHEVVQPEYEIGLEMLRQAMLAMNVSTFETQQLLDRVRDELYSPHIPTLLEESGVGRLLPSRGLLDLYWIYLPERSPLVGMTLRKARIRERSGATIAAISRGNELLTNPDSEITMQAGDTIAAIGTAGQFELLEKMIGDSPSEE